MFFNRMKVTLITLNEINRITDISCYQARINNKHLARIFEARKTS
jgi:hypothetical protein